MRCLVLYRYVLCLVTFFKSLNTQEQEKVFENNNNKKQTRAKISLLAWLLTLMKLFAWLICHLGHEQTNYGTDKPCEPLREC